MPGVLGALAVAMDAVEHVRRARAPPRTQRRPGRMRHRAGRQHALSGHAGARARDARLARSRVSSPSSPNTAAPASPAMIQGSFEVTGPRGSPTPRRRRTPDVLGLDRTEPPHRPGEVDEMRLERRPQRVHPSFLRQQIALPRVAARARREDVAPAVGTPRDSGTRWSRVRHSRWRSSCWLRPQNWQRSCRGRRGRYWSPDGGSGAATCTNLTSRMTAGRGIARRSLFTNGPSASTISALRSITSRSARRTGTMVRGSNEA